MTSPWEIWIDTGGTFTDCLARDTRGRRHSAKVLSSSALRGRIVQAHPDGSLSTDADWAAIPGLVDGFQFELLQRQRAATVGSTIRGGGQPPPAAIRPSATVREPQDSCAVVRHHPDGRLELENRTTPLPLHATFQVRSAEPAPLLAARIITATPAGQPLPPVSMRLATTRATNALLERSGAATALFITHGFGDLLLIGDQQRPDLFALKIEKPAPLYEAVIEVPERIAADGSVTRTIELEDVVARARALRDRGIRTAAIALMHSYLNNRHEQQLAEALGEIGFEHVSCSSDLAPFIRLLPRAETAVVDAYLGPVITDHLRDVRDGLSGGRLHVMTSAGGLCRADAYAARDSLLSGPAGGVAGAAAAGQAAGFLRVIGFDMGGTSTDVARFDGDFEYEFEHRVGGVRLLAPALAIETVAAGGGSICWYDGRRLRVGPQSAGADPGPACYGAGGPLTLTDVNLLLGRLDAGQFAIPIDVAAARAALAELKDLMRQPGSNVSGGEGVFAGSSPDALPEAFVGAAHATPQAAAATATEAREREGGSVDDDALLDGLLEIADARMADAIAEVSIRRGYDPAEFALVAFGGAGGQHACSVARRLGMEAIVMPADASLLSAYGLGHARLERFAQRQVLELLDDVQDDLEKWIEELVSEAQAQFSTDDVQGRDVRVRRRIINLRLRGQETSLMIEFGDGLVERFRQRYDAMYGHEPEGKPIEVESLRVIVSTPQREIEQVAARTTPIDLVAARRVRARLGGRWDDVPAFQRTEMPEGGRISGPALVFDERSTYVIDSGWQVETCRDGSLILRNRAARAEDPPRAHFSGSRTCGVQPDAVRRALFTNRFTSIARAMGQQLMRTAISTNVKERLDFSCALLDPDGQLLVNAPHLPVHLGALGACVRCLRDAIEMKPGDVIITNHPGFGGSHLPDVTVVTPVFSDRRGLLGFAANRAHHAEIGGRRPGAMPPDARRLAEEGVVIPPAWLVEGGIARFEHIEGLLRGSAFPSRAIADNIADLRAQVASNHHGAAALRELAARYGPAEIRMQMESITHRAEELTRSALARLADGRYEAIERLDDGSPLRVTIDVRGDQATFDFTGSAPQHPGNLNATPGIVRSVVIYVLRLLIGAPARDEPMNEGMMRPVKIILPEGMLNPAFSDDDRESPAVVGGNVETSQRLTDTLLKALRLCAGSQGTMNNVLFGRKDFGYYETVCGGSGAGPTFRGADAVHTHMTNTRITDCEVLEHRYPVVLERFAIRQGSGGAGRFRGGDGAVRIYRFQADLSLSLLTQHRREGPFALDGGESGRPGRQVLIRSDGSEEVLGSSDAREVQAGDRLVLETPGGGGWGSPATPDR